MGPTAEGLALSAQLASRYFRPGGVVRGAIQLSTSQKVADAASEVAYIVAQIHGHVTVDSNLLTLPVVHVHSPRAASSDERAHLERKMSGEVFMFDKMGAALPDVRSFSGDTGTCIYQSAPSVLLSDLNVAPTPEELQAGEAGASEREKRCSREFAIALPEGICPTFRGNSARVFYAVSITAQSTLPGSKPVSVHLSFEVYASEYLFAANTIASAEQIAALNADKSAEEAPHTSNNGDSQPSAVPRGGMTRSGRRMERSTSFAPAPVSVRKGSEIAFELRPALMHGRVETDLMQRAQTSIFTIGKDNSHLVRFLLTKQFYQPGEILLGVFDFTRASIPCYEISATLCLEEKLASMSLDPDRVIQSKVVGSYQEYTHGALQTNLRLCIPQDALPTIRTDLVSFQWLLRFEFCAGLPADEAPSDKNLQRQKFQWQVPVAVKPPIALERAALSNVPRKLFSGSSRVVSLSSA